MNMNIHTRTYLSAIALLSLAPLAQAQIVTLPNAYVQRVLVTGDSTFGGCMAMLSVNPATYAPCANSWVSFSCSGHFSDKDLAFRKLDQAQLALALNKAVFVQIDTSKKHNAYCYASRVDVIR